MTRTSGPTSLVLAAFSGVIASPGLAQTPATKTPPAAVEIKAWTGDLDGMIQRRAIRILVPYSKTHYFIDKGVQRGLAYEMGRQFEDDLNTKLKTRHLRVHVVFVPVSRDQLIPYLLEGKGDVAAASLTITPERQNQVDFSVPTFTEVSEIVVTGPRSPAIAKVDDLAGQEVFVRKSSSYWESLVALNERFRSEGKKEAVLKPAPETLEDEDLLEMVNAGLVKTVVVDNHMATFWKQVFPAIIPHPDVALRTGAQIAPAIRKDSPKLKAELEAFAKKYGTGTAFRNVLLQRYLKRAPATPRARPQTRT